MNIKFMHRAPFEKTCISKNIIYLGL
jgi:hypothetical protein